MEPSERTLTRWERFRRIDKRVWDGLLAIGLLAIAILTLRNGTHPGDGARDADLWASLLTVAAYLPLWWWRRRPLAVLAVISAVSAVYGLAGYPLSPVLPLALACYSSAALRPRSRAQSAAFAAAAVASVVVQLGGHLDDVNWVELLIGTFFNVGLPIGIGRIMWNRRRRLERERELAAHDAVTAERARIARELHDVVAHSMSVMVVQAGAARAVLRKQPDEAERALRTIEDAGRTGLAEMRRLLEADKEDANGAPLAPQPGLADLDELIERMRRTGLPVESMTEGTPRPLPLGVDLSAYRIVQEALTNTLKHGGRAAHARVLVRYGEDEVEVEVADDGRGVATDHEGAGHGLVGMRERVALFGGALTTGPRPGGGFEVRARIPADGAP